MAAQAGRGATLIALLAGIPARAQDEDPPEVAIGERLFLETRFAEFFARKGGVQLHFDGEFASLRALVRETLLGRNYGWLPTERAQAIAQIARVIRKDDGRGELAHEFGGSYRRVLAGVDPRIPEALVLPRPLRLDVEKASDVAIVELVAKLIARYVEQLEFTRDASGAFEASPYDRFLLRNSLPRKPKPRETPAAYTRRLAAALDAVPSPLFVADVDGPFAFSFHDTGVTRFEYDDVHGAGAFAALAIPTLAEREAPQRHGPLPRRRRRGAPGVRGSRRLERSLQPRPVARAGAAEGRDPELARREDEKTGAARRLDRALQDAGPARPRPLRPLHAQRRVRYPRVRRGRGGRGAARGVPARAERGLRVGWRPGPESRRRAPHDHALGAQAPGAAEADRRVHRHRASSPDGLERAGLALRRRDRRGQARRDRPTKETLAGYLKMQEAGGPRWTAPGDPRKAQETRVRESALFLAENMHRVPVHVIRSTSRTRRRSRSCSTSPRR